ncbi:hypothetical protein F352_058 [Campylobacter phage F352]|uniref:Uncharacterized protein n=6 Tax=Fletchervirus CPX TaxID=1110702 RepID=A0A7T3N560_9CAUD|nr:hypothetical protein F348_058 [Campylobacter phage F348]QPX63362.1 hypothetical protein F352_058 [Campylobacter phage F352]QPX64685.1 hypothetical protein F367_059 [Campylobacter phage F367]QPX64849.1 hypothetical protein F368_058 [Campylobacter phage F368]QPX65498.1 hypothetical protein F374_057 [Campylobacter phage F374]QPX65665.1 hypothetical protein F375_058 [Campylobacter phage F375]
MNKIKQWIIELMCIFYPIKIKSTAKDNYYISYKFKFNKYYVFGDRGGEVFVENYEDALRIADWMDDNS